MEWEYKIDGKIIPVYKLTQWWVAKWVGGITLNKKIYLKKPQGHSNNYIRHEYIHVLQQKELSYILFIILYIVFWCWNVIRFKKKCYFNIPFEREAYECGNIEGFLNTRPKNNWKNYKI